MFLRGWDKTAQYRHLASVLLKTPGGKQSTGSPDVLAPAGPDGGCHAFGIQFISELLDGSFIGRLKGSVWNGMKPDQIDAAPDPMQDP
jgi:hypothetical protein